MTGIEVSCIIIGFACICISFFVSRKTSAAGAGSSEAVHSPAAEVWTEKDEQMVRERLDEILQEQQVECIEDAKDQMGTICNEKIMAVDEFSTQILEKINSNHQEVVFMYNMLNEKQKELKMVMSESSRGQRPAADGESSQDTGRSGEKTAQVKMADPVPVPSGATGGTQASSLKPARAVPVRREQAGVPLEERQRAAELEQAAMQSSGTSAPTGLSQVTKTKKKAGQQKTAAAAQASTPTPSVAGEPKGKADQSGDVQSEDSIPGNVNLEIQRMYKEGKSVLEISKALDVGQGEVKLVIALYGGKKA